MEEVHQRLKCVFRDKILGDELVPLEQSLNRILSEDVVSMECIPAFRRSTVDGYAVQVADTVGCSESMPAFLRVVGEVFMDPGTHEGCSHLTVKPSQAVYVPTGGQVPEGADAVCMIEHAELFGSDVAISHPVSALENIMGVGDDVEQGEVVLTKGTQLLPRHIGVLAALGLGQVMVKKQPRVSILSTGDELVDLNEPIQRGKIRDINAYALLALVEQCGGRVVNRDCLKDDFNHIRTYLKQAIEESDLILISGGSSVGTKDQTPEIINSLGNPGVFIHGIAIKPGKPTIVARVADTAIFGLPGHPAACMVAFEAVVGPYIKEQLLGSTAQKKVVPAISGFQSHAVGGRDVFQMVTLETEGSDWKAHPVQGKSGMISMMSRAQGYVKIGMNHEGLHKNSPVLVNLFE